MVWQLGLRPVMQWTHNKFGAADRFNEATYIQYLLIIGSQQNTNRKNLKDLYSSCLFLKGLQNCNSLKDQSSYVDVAKAITTYY